MRINLDRVDPKKVDPADMSGFLSRFSEYSLEALEDSESFALPSYLIKCKKVLILGTGESGIVAQFIKDLCHDSSVFIDCSSNSDLPGWVDKDTLVIALSHSGNTDEVLQPFVLAFQKNAKLLAITSGGKLQSLCSKFRSPVITFHQLPESKLAFPYLFIIPVIVLRKLGIVELSKEEFSQAIDLVDAQINKISLNIHTAVNPAKDLAIKIVDTEVIAVGSANLESAANRFASSASKNGKNISFSCSFQELGNSLISGLNFPRELLKKVSIVALESKYNRGEIKILQNITSQILLEKRLNYFRLDFPQSSSRFSEILLSVNFVDFVGLYLGILNQANPMVSAEIDFIKTQISKQ